MEKPYEDFPAKPSLDDVEIRRAHKESRPVEEEDSPFEIVRATVSNKDDPTLPTFTFRVWVLGLLFTIILSFVNQFFWFRKTPLSLGVLVVTLLSFPLGKFLARVLPSGRLNPGPFNIKEHVLITAFANAAGGSAYAIDIITIKRIFYGSDLGFLGSFLLVLTTQCVGYGMAGIARRFLVRPAAMIWPANLVSVTLFRTLHEEEEPRGMTRMKMFGLVSFCSFLYYFLPGYVATFLATISILCYAAPDSRLINQVGSGSRGLGVLSFSLDWNTFSSFLGSPLITPFWAEVNTIIGFVLVCWVLIPLGYYNNVWEAQKYPLLSSKTFQVNGSRYNPLKVMDKATSSLNETLYEHYGPLRLSFFFAISYGVGFATLSAVIVHTILYHGKEILSRFKDARNLDDDIHAKLMDRYDEAPDWWYFGFFLLNLALAIVVCEVYDIHLPWWGVLLAIFMALVFILPIGIITAIANTTPGLNIITEFVIGYILPGYPIANVTFKTYGYISMAQAITFLSDLKLGHYMKIPPKDMFMAQTAGTLIAGLMNVSTAYMMYWLKPDICTTDVGEWTCPNANVFYSASVIWGVIGPARMFGPGAYYNFLMWFFVFGAIAPIPFWLLSRKYPDSFWKYVHTPVILGATAVMPPAQPVMYPTWFIVGFIFQFYIYRYHHVWWAKFNYVFSAGMDTGIVVCGLILFFFQSRDINIDWWGNLPDCSTQPKL